MMSRLYKLSLLTLLLAPDPSTVLAQAQTQLEQVVVTATQEETGHLNLPMSISVISREDLLTVRHVHINEAFQRVPGAWISRGNGQESLTALRSPVLTGPGSCGAFFMASDGISLRAPGFCNVNQLFDANTEQAERIEVLKGPSTALYGSGAMHGVINIISPAPTEALSHTLSAEAGPHDYRRGRYFIANTLGRHGFMLAANATTDGGYKRSSGYDQYKGNLRHQYQGEKFSVDTIFTATDLDQDTAGFITGFEAYKDSDRQKENPNPQAYRKADAMQLQSSVSLPLDEFSRLVFTPYWRDNDMEFLMHFLPWQPVEKNGHDSFGLNSKYYREGTWLKSVSGVDLESTDGWLEETQEDPFVSDNQPEGVHYDYQVDALVAAAWTQLSWDLARQLTLSTGARFEYTEYDYDNRTGDGPACAPSATDCRFYRPPDREDDFDNWSFNVSALWDFLPGHAAFLRGAHGFRAPQATELYRLQGSQAEADLDSESLDSVELGARGLHRNLEYEVGLYYTEKDDVIFQDADRFNISGASTLHYGLEVSLRWQLAQTVDFALDATLAHHEYDSDINLLGSSGNINGNEIDTAPEHFGSARLGWEFMPRFRAELEWVHMGEYYLEPDNQHEYDGHDLFNLRLTGAWKQLDLGIRATNITDVDYAERADFGFNSYRYFVGEPRSVYFEVGYRFAP
jgi:outer membrane receptor protein involved in Fe transport